MTKINKAIFFDIDGTLLPFGHEVWTDLTIDILKRLRERGYELFIATGRHHINIPEFIKTSGFFRGYICLNGQMIFEDGESVHEATLESKTVEAIKEFCDQRNLSVIFATANYFHLSKEDKEFEEYVAELLDYRVEPNPEAPILQATMYLSPDNDEALQKVIPNCVITRWNSRYIDINAKQVSKAAGIKFFIDKYQIRKSDTIAVGDAGNDRSMLEFAGLGIAMGNADEETKTYADLVIGKDVDGGLKDLLEMLK